MWSLLKRVFILVEAPLTELAWSTKKDGIGGPMPAEVS